MNVIIDSLESLPRRVLDSQPLKVTPVTFSSMWRYVQMRPFCWALPKESTLKQQLAESGDSGLAKDVFGTVVSPESGVEIEVDPTEDFVLLIRPSGDGNDENRAGRDFEYFTVSVQRPCPSSN